MMKKKSNLFKLTSAAALSFTAASPCIAYAEDQTVESTDPFAEIISSERYYSDFISSLRAYPDFSSLVGAGTVNQDCRPGIGTGGYYASDIPAETSTFLMPCMYQTNITVHDVDTDIYTYEVCREQCYQGICITPEYILITAYCTDLRNDGEGRHNSVIYVLDRTGNYIDTVTVSRTSSNHAGGIAYDPDHNMLWIAGSAERTVNGIGYDKFLNILNNDEERYISFSVKMIVPDALKKVSFVSYSTSEHLLYAGYYGSSAELPRMYGYEIDYEGSYPSLVTCTSCTLPEYCNGAVIVENESGRYLVSESSYGRKLSSYLYVNDLDTGRRIIRMKLPPMLEQLAYDDESGTISGIFESGAYRYAQASSKPLVIVDRGFSVPFSSLTGNSSYTDFLNLGKVAYTELRS